MNQRHASVLFDAAVKCHRDIIRQRTREAMRDKIRRRERCGKVPYGFDLAHDGKTLIPNAQEQEAIRLIKKLRTDGKTLRYIAEELDHRGVATKEGGRWACATVHHILHPIRKSLARSTAKR